MAHQIEIGNTIYKFKNITPVSKLSQVEKYDWVIMVETKNGLDIWATKLKGRGCNELVHYYELAFNRQINETDLIIMANV